jgi:class 3 adenylate cyclase/tetratricopeptide (TPR) repeat protein
MAATRRAGIASVVPTCSNCGHENPGGAKFCNECATSLTAAPARPVAEERKVVTALFCDLVGFTSTSESADPEDVDTMLATYFEMARAAIEAFGGVVEKFIGDAVVGVFGVPAAHEDDPERAIRAGLRICEDAEGLTSVGGAPLRLRVGINTGEAFVRLGVSAASGEGFLTGDSVNTASRIQSVAPEMGVAVGLATYDVTVPVFDYDELEPATLKGKSEPVRVFHAKAPRSRFGTDPARVNDTPFIGRELDLSILKDTFDETVAADSPRMIMVVGEPGLGKSRIVAELAASTEGSPDTITWLQGRCLPYGEGVTFWALAEILKTHAGILESDPLDLATSKLDAVLPEGDARLWLRQRLLPLLGIEGASDADREELFTAWRRFLEHVAEQDPTVLVFEDLHWADEAMLGFLEHLADRAEGVPLLIVGTARPEFLDRHPGLSGTLRDTKRISLAPLTEDETARLVSALLETTVLPAELQQPILDRAGGNPLYAEEFVRLLKDKDLLIEKGASWELREGAEVPLPDSVQALIAARLDMLSADTKSMLADAAVVGRVFWAGAVSEIGDRDPGDVIEVLRELSRKDLVRPIRRSSIEGEVEYAFWHVLVRDVAYRQLPRAMRAARHAAAARWIESKAPERVEDLADVLAFHYATALELARVIGRSDQAEDLRAPALRFLTLAGERALGLDSSAAVVNLERALALTPAGHPERPQALARFGVACLDAGRYTDAAEALEEAVRSLRARGDLPSAARAMRALGDTLVILRDPRGSRLFSEALALVEPLPPGPELVEALTTVGYEENSRAGPEDGARYADRALAVAEELGLPRPARALGLRGIVRTDLGDARGVEDLREALALAIAAGQGSEAVATLSIHLGIATSMFAGPAAGLEVVHEAIAYAQARGLTRLLETLENNTLDGLFETGRLDEVLQVADDLVARFEASGDARHVEGVRGAQVRVWALRGPEPHVADVCDRLESASRGTEDSWGAFDTVGPAALARAALGQKEAAATLLAELAAGPGNDPGNPNFTASLPSMVRTALMLGEQDLALRFVEGFEPLNPYAQHSLVTANAALSEARGDLQAATDAYADAADRWERFGIVPEEAFAVLGQGRCLVGLSRSAEAAPVLQHAREMFERLRAAPALAETDGLLEQATALSS